MLLVSNIFIASSSRDMIFVHVYWAQYDDFIHVKMCDEQISVVTIPYLQTLITSMCWEVPHPCSSLKYIRCC
jgi:hypothetical protein